MGELTFFSSGGKAALLIKPNEINDIEKETAPQALDPYQSALIIKIKALVKIREFVMLGSLNRDTIRSLHHKNHLILIMRRKKKRLLTSMLQLMKQYSKRTIWCEQLNEQRSISKDPSASKLQRPKNMVP